MDEFKPVSTKMAKVQNLSLNPAKISGCCGRLMCCLRYEQPAYEELVKNVPKTGAFVETPDGYGNVNQVNILRQTVRVKLDGEGDDAYRQYDAEDVAVVPGGRPRDGSIYAWESRLSAIIVRFRLGVLSIMLTPPGCNIGIIT